MTQMPPDHFISNASRRLGSRPRFVENKLVNHKLIQDLLALSANANQWTNFGPVSRMLEDRLAEVLEIPGHLTVVACANATIATHALVAMHHHLNGRPLRWVTSAFGFYSSCDGILQDAQIRDCGPDGMLDLDALNPADFDGMIATNIFGRQSDMLIYQQYAEKHGKILIVDSAMGFQAGGHGANECISLHHTKPWGFGEGGCAVVNNEYASLFRDLLSFGHSAPHEPINRLAVNGKISDVACAYQLMHLAQLDVVRDSYLEQFHRIAAIGDSLGLVVLGGDAVHPGIPSNVPLLYPRATILPEDPWIPARKYYFPLTPTPVATDIYSRVVNVACHSEMSCFSDKEIGEFLSRFQIEN